MTLSTHLLRRCTAVDGGAHLAASNTRVSRSRTSSSSATARATRRTSAMHTGHDRPTSAHAVGTAPRLGSVKPRSKLGAHMADLLANSPHLCMAAVTQQVRVATLSPSSARGRCRSPARPPARIGTRTEIPDARGRETPPRNACPERFLRGHLQCPIPLGRCAKGALLSLVVCRCARRHGAIHSLHITPIRSPATTRPRPHPPDVVALFCFPRSFLPAAVPWDERVCV